QSVFIFVIANHLKNSRFCLVSFSIYITHLSYHSIVLMLCEFFFIIYIAIQVTVQPKKDKSIIHELAQCIIDLFFVAE
ncbi:hypothetical protein, partial [Butyribacter intestini]|uniref:hypothetical protein n=1 Tax=Butyribacter intestini TaxID=1703332 RepID=UPI003AB1ACCA